MSRLIVALIRHGDYHQLADAPSAWQPFSLNQQGIEQASTAVSPILDFMQQEDLIIHPACHTSQLLRAWQTGEIISQGLTEQLSVKEPIAVIETPALAERSVGSVANLTTHQIKEIVDADPRYSSLPDDWKSNSAFRLPFPGAESLMESGIRVAEYIQHTVETLATTAEWDTLVLFVGHGAAFRHAAHHFGILEFNQIAKLSMYHCSPIFFEFSNHGDWKHIGGEWKVRQAKTEYTD